MNISHLVFYNMDTLKLPSIFSVPFLKIAISKACIDFLRFSILSTKRRRIEIQESISFTRELFKKAQASAAHVRNSKAK